MKKILLFSYLAIWLFGYLTINVVAQTKTLTPFATASASPTVIIDKDIQQLKDKIADKVSEIRENNNKAVSGFVVNNDGNMMKIGHNGEENQVKLDDALTKYFKIAGAQKKEIKADDIKKNDYVIVSGIIGDNIITANIVLVDENFLVDSGKIIEINKDNYNIKVLTSDKNIYSLDIETYTKQFMINIKTLDLERIGFSKIKEGDTVHFVIKKIVSSSVDRDSDYSAIKILIIPQEYFIK